MHSFTSLNHLFLPFSLPSYCLFPALFAFFLYFLHQLHFKPCSVFVKLSTNVCNMFIAHPCSGNMSFKRIRQKVSLKPPHEMNITLLRCLLYPNLPRLTAFFQTDYSGVKTYLFLGAASHERHELPASYSDNPPVTRDNIQLGTVNENDDNNTP